MTNIGIFFIALGLAFNFFGCLGLVRLPDVYNRLQAATKSVTLGTCSILFGAFLLSGLSATGLKSLLCIAFLLLTAPVAAHAIARGGRRGGVEMAPESVCDAYAEAGGAHRLSSGEEDRGSERQPARPARVIE